ncbi:LysE family translocator [Acinetobacter sp. YH12045]|uniref:LysE family translocator n=1 Tax=Acinetobacter sp. YH12045 TaxID=2601051 RepID=UPI0015D35223
MNYSEYFLYCVAVIVMIATPGPVMLLVASAGLQGGYKKAFQTIVGTNFASLILIVLSVCILKGILNVNADWLDGIKILGCLYIAYIGFDILKEVTIQPTAQSLQLKAAQGGFKKGLIVGISNPKDIIFFASFFPQFVGITPHLNLSLIVLTLSWIVLDFATLSLVYLSFHRLSKSRWYKKLLALCGLILVVVAIYGIYSIFTV